MKKKPKRVWKNRLKIGEKIFILVYVGTKKRCKELMLENMDLDNLNYRLYGYKKRKWRIRSRKISAFLPNSNDKGRFALYTS
jgi:hypothetical protein